MSTKKCTKCSVEKPLSEFSKNNQQQNNLSPWCKKCVGEKGKEWYKKNKTKHLKYARKYNKKWTKENTQHIKEYRLLYIENNKEKIKKYDKIYRKNNIYVSRWRDILKSTLKRFDRKKTSSTQTTLGYSSIQLKEYLDKQGMDWDNHTIDHKVPLSWFKLSTPCSLVNALVNLQPLTLKENVLKSNNFCSPVPTSYINQIKPYIKKQYLALLKVEEV